MACASNLTSPRVKATLIARGVGESASPLLSSPLMHLPRTTLAANLSTIIPGASASVTEHQSRIQDACPWEALDVVFFKQFRVPLFPRYCNSFVQRMPRHYKRTIWPYPSGARSIPKYCESLVIIHLKRIRSSQIKTDKYVCLKSAKKIQFMILVSRI